MFGPSCTRNPTDHSRRPVVVRSNGKRRRGFCDGEVVKDVTRFPHPSPSPGRRRYLSATTTTTRKRFVSKKNKYAISVNRRGPARALLYGWKTGRTNRRVRAAWAIYRPYLRYRCPRPVRPKRFLLSRTLFPTVFSPRHGSLRNTKIASFVRGRLPFFERLATATRAIANTTRRVYLRKSRRTISEKLASCRAIIP